MSDKLVSFPLPLGKFYLDPNTTLDLIRTKPHAFILLSLISFKIVSDGGSYGLERDEVYLNDSLFKTLGRKACLTAYERDKALKQLIELNFITIRKPPFKGYKIAKLLVNPFTFKLGDLHA